MVFVLVISVNCFISFPEMVPLSLLQGSRRYAMVNLVYALVIIATTVFTYFMIDETNGLVLLAVVSTVGAVARLGWFETLIRRLKTIAPGEGQEFDRELSKRLFKFGSKSFLQGGAYQIEAGMPVVAIGLLLGLCATDDY